MPSSSSSPPQSRPRGFSRSHMSDPKERIEQILADRSTLRMPLLSRENWVKNELRPHCYFCERKFRPFSRKHHCRACGDVVCSNCNHRRDVQVGSAATETLNVRLCLDCIDKALGNQEVEASMANLSGSSSSSARCKSGLVDSIVSTSTMTTASLSQSTYEDIETDHEHDYETDDGASSDCSSEHESRLSNLTDTAWRGPTSNGTLGFVPEEKTVTCAGARGAVDPRVQQILEACNVRGEYRQKEFDALCELASRALHAGVAAVAFLSPSHQWYKSRIGISQAELPLEVAFCPGIHACSAGPTVVLDATQDERLRENPLVVGSAHIRFYASTPIRDPESQVVLGSIFVMDPKPKSHVPSRTYEVLAYVSSAAEQLLSAAASKGDKAHGRKGDRAFVKSNRTSRGRRVLSEPGPETDDDGDDEEAEAVARAPRSKSGVTLYDPEVLGPRRHPARRSSPRPGPREQRSSEHEWLTLGRLDRQSSTSEAASEAPASTRSSSVSIDMCEELMQQINTTQQLLAALSSRHSGLHAATTGGGVVEPTPSELAQREVDV